ncbi:hypothetical protein M9435_002490 [Picochlorum sp. BPE23]|nr:hypothetical protein M9435_002490 [Picochlorum sp. BPE23]
MRIRGIRGGILLLQLIVATAAFGLVAGKKKNKCPISRSYFDSLDMSDMKSNCEKGDFSKTSDCDRCWAAIIDAMDGGVFDYVDIQKIMASSDPLRELESIINGCKWRMKKAVEKQEGRGVGKAVYKSAKLCRLENQDDYPQTVSEVQKLSISALFG